MQGGRKRGNKEFSFICARGEILEREIHLLPLIRYSNDRDCSTCNASLGY